MPNPWDKPPQQQQANPWDRPAAAAPVPAPAPVQKVTTPAGNTIGAAPDATWFDRIHSMVANSAVGNSLETALPKVADALHLHPTETVNSPTYQSDKEQLLAPQYIMPNNPHGHTAGIARGALTGLGKLSSGESLGTMGAMAATAGLAAPLAPAAAALKIGGAAVGAKGVGEGLFGAGKAYFKGDSAGGDEQLGETLPNALMMMPLAAEGARRVPEAVRRVLAGDIDAQIPGQGRMTAANRYGAMLRAGMSPNAADATNSPVMQAVRRGNEGSAGGGHFYERLKGENLQAASDAASNLEDSQSPLDPETGGGLIGSRLKQPFLDLQDRANDQLSAMSPLGREEGGASLQGLAKSKMDEMHNQATEEYKDLSEQYGATPAAKPGTVSNEATDILRKNERFAKQSPSLISRKVMNVVEDASRLGGTEQQEAMGPPTVSDLIRNRSALMDLTRDPEIVKSAHAADIQRLIGAHDAAIMESLPPEGQAAWRATNAKWESMKNTFDNPSNPFYHAVRTGTPSTLTEGVGGPSPEGVDALRKITGDEGVGIVRRGVGEKLLGRSGTGEFDLKNFGNRLERTPEEYRENLFGSDGHEQLRKIASDYADIEPYRAAAFDTPPEKLVQGVGPQTGSAMRDLAPRIGAEGVGAIQRGVTDKLLRTDRHGEFNFPMLGGRWNNMPEDYKGALFGESPGGTARLDDLAISANTLDFNPNRSGTGHQLQKISDVGSLLQAPASAAAAAFTGHPIMAAGLLAGPVAYNAAQYGIGRTMNSPTFVKWLMTPKPSKPFFGSPAWKAAVAAGGPKRSDE
jgi:hypothetical protein